MSTLQASANYPLIRQNHNTHTHTAPSPNTLQNQSLVSKQAYEKKRRNNQKKLYISLPTAENREQRDCLLPYNILPIDMSA